MPVQYILGDWDFHFITLKMQPPVFIPRPETEQLVEMALDRISMIDNPKVLEIGCGTGAISLAMLHSNKKVRFQYCMKLFLSNILFVRNMIS